MATTTTLAVIIIFFTDQRKVELGNRALTAHEKSYGAIISSIFRRGTAETESGEEQLWNLDLGSNT